MRNEVHRVARREPAAIGAQPRTPDDVLARVKAEEAHSKRGKLKIFLGYSAGVGKTYAMLEASRQRRKEIDLVIGIVETHGRSETNALLEGFEVLPRRHIEYRGITLTELDIDALLARHPQLAIVDELAHTNAPGSRHEKRYEDVEELLDAGIDVYTTLNVQHVESLRNVVAQITGVWIRETIPDSVIDEAAEIELVDLPPDELIKRVQDGKVYLPEQIARATNEFFRKGNLTALRELAMRIGAERVDEQVKSYMAAHAIRGPWPTRERILACVSSGTLATRLVRAARRLASQLDAEWFAIYVETPGDVRLSPEQRDRLATNLRLAERLGAKTLTVRGDTVAGTVTEWAAENNVTKILVGRSRGHRLLDLIGRSIPNEVVRKSSHIDVYVVTGHEPSARTAASAEKRKPRSFQGYINALILTLVATLLGQLVHQLFDPANIMAIYLLCVVIAAIAWGFGPSITVATLGVLALDFFFVPTTFTFSVADKQYLFTLFALLATGLIISYLTSRVRQQTEASRGREMETATLYALSRELTTTIGLEPKIHVIARSARSTFGREIVIFLPGPEDHKNLKAHPGSPTMAIGEADLAAAQWAFQHQKVVGAGTDTLPSARARYRPLNTDRGPVGVIGLWMSDGAEPLTSSQTRLFEAIADLAAVSIERTQLAEEARNAQVLAATDKLQTALLNSISHDLRTPLVSIIGALSSLGEESMGLDEAARKKLIDVARGEADRLNHLITNLLDSSRIEAGAMKMSRQPSGVEDIIGVALGQTSGHAGDRRISVDVPEGTPMVDVDLGLIVLVMVNLLDNAIKYSPPGTTIEIRARTVDRDVEVSVADQGIGVPPQDLTRVFEKFYRVHRPDSVAGTGLGLSICKGIVEAHGGRISAENRPGGGTIMRVFLPVADQSKPAEQVNA